MKQTANAVKNASIYRPESSSKTRRERFLKSFLILCTTMYKQHIWFLLGIFPKEKESKRDKKGDVHLPLNLGVIIKGFRTLFGISVLVWSTVIQNYY